MKHYLLFYEVVDDYAARGALLRVAHLEHAQRARERGELVLAGALADPVDGAVLLFRGSSPVVARIPSEQLEWAHAASSTSCSA